MFIAVFLRRWHRVLSASAWSLDTCHRWKKKWRYCRKNGRKFSRILSCDWRCFDLKKCLFGKQIEFLHELNCMNWNGNVDTNWSGNNFVDKGGKKQLVPVGTVLCKVVDFVGELTCPSSLGDQEHDGFASSPSNFWVLSCVVLLCCIVWSFVSSVCRLPEVERSKASLVTEWLGDNHSREDLFCPTSFDSGAFDWAAEVCKIPWFFMRSIRPGWSKASRSGSNSFVELEKLQLFLAFAFWIASIIRPSLEFWVKNSCKFPFNFSSSSANIFFNNVLARNEERESWSLPWEKEFKLLR